MSQMDDLSCLVNKKMLVEVRFTCAKFCDLWIFCSLEYPSD